VARSTFDPSSSGEPAGRFRLYLKPQAAGDVSVRPRRGSFPSDLVGVDGDCIGFAVSIEAMYFLAGPEVAIDITTLVGVGICLAAGARDMARILGNCFDSGRILGNWSSSRQLWRSRGAGRRCQWSGLGWICQWD